MVCSYLYNKYKIVHRYVQRNQPIQINTIGDERRPSICLASNHQYVPLSNPSQATNNNIDICV